MILLFHGTVEIVCGGMKLTSSRFTVRLLKTDTAQLTPHGAVPYCTPKTGRLVSHLLTSLKKHESCLEQILPAEECLLHGRVHREIGGLKTIGKAALGRVNS